MFFSDIIGQEMVKQRLTGTVREGRISHAQLFTGPGGTGKLGLAIAYAQYISCRNRTDHDSCGSCPSCRKYAKLVHPDLHFVFPVYKPKNVQKSYCDDFLPQWRETVLKSHYFSLNHWTEVINAENAQATIYANESESIIRKLSMKPFESEYKTMIIWLPERMNVYCSNKLLKMIEEPPSKTLFLLVTEDEAGIIGTIRSRTQIIRVPRIENTDMAEALGKKGEYTQDQIGEIVHLSNGNYLEALEYDNPRDDKQYFFDIFQRIMRNAFKAEVSVLMDIAEEMAAIGRERQKDFFQYALRLVREFFMLNLGKSSLVYLSREEKEFGVKFSPFINERNVIPINQVFEEGFRDISMNGNSRVVFTDTVLRIVRLIKK